MLEIPFPEEDDMSVDECDGCIDPDEIPADGFDDAAGDIDEQEFNEGVPPIPHFQQLTGPVNITEQVSTQFLQPDSH